MKIIEKKGSFQMEDWRESLNLEKYPGLAFMSYSVGCYPLATHAPKSLMFIERGRKVRIGLHFRTFEDARECFDNLVNGRKNIKDYADAIDDPRYLACID